MARTSSGFLIGVLGLSLLGCPNSAPESPVEPAVSVLPGVDATRPEVPPAALDPLAPDWSDEVGWHRIALLPGVQRRPQALSASRRSELVAVLGARGRRVTLVARNAEPRHVMLPIDIDAADVALADGDPPQIVVTSPRNNVLVRLALTAADPALVVREELSVGRTSLETTPQGVVEVLDVLQRPDPGVPAVRGLAAPSGRRYRAVRRDAMAAIIGNGEGGRRMAMLARIPKAEAVRVIGLDPADPAESAGLDRGWLAAWTGEVGPKRRLHFVRFDSEGRVLLTTPAPPIDDAPPEAFDLRAAVLGNKEVVVGLPSRAGLQVWRYVPGPDGQRLKIRLIPGSEGSLLSE